MIFSIINLRKKSVFVLVNFLLTKRDDISMKKLELRLLELISIVVLEYVPVCVFSPKNE